MPFSRILKYRDDYRSNRSNLLNKWETSSLNRIQMELVRMGSMPIQNKDRHTFKALNSIEKKIKQLQEYEGCPDMDKIWESDDIKIPVYCDNNTNGNFESEHVYACPSAAWTIAEAAAAGISGTEAYTLQSPACLPRILVRLTVSVSLSLMKPRAKIGDYVMVLQKITEKGGNIG